jgi:fructose-bisphosphate aldolase class I
MRLGPEAQPGQCHPARSGRPVALTWARVSPITWPRQATDDGTPFAELLAGRGLVPGIKVDRGANPLAGAPDEKVTEGLDGLRERLAGYRELGARFTKWRAVLAIGPGLPSDYAIRVNAHALARFAALSQEQGLVPIVEPEALMDGSHTIERSYATTAVCSKPWSASFTSTGFGSRACC